ncbi:MAG: hypothetical protein E6713_03050 [Sporomusaceae bacterium]|nr:hypothetical protein [Sporomusaceae bacterium]
MCPYKSFCPKCHVSSGAEEACARNKAAAIQGIEAVPDDMGPIDYHRLAELCRPGNEHADKITQIY